MLLLLLELIINHYDLLLMFQCNLSVLNVSVTLTVIGLLIGPLLLDCINVMTAVSRHNNVSSFTSCFASPHCSHICTTIFFLSLCVCVSLSYSGYNF